VHQLATIETEQITDRGTIIRLVAGGVIIIVGIAVVGIIVAGGIVVVLIHGRGMLLLQLLLLMERVLIVLKFYKFGFPLMVSLILNNCVFIEKLL